MCYPVHFSSRPLKVSVGFINFALRWVFVSRAQEFTTSIMEPLKHWGLFFRSQHRRRHLLSIHLKHFLHYSLAHSTSVCVRVRKGAGCSSFSSRRALPSLGISFSHLRRLFLSLSLRAESDNFYIFRLFVLDIISALKADRALENWTEWIPHSVLMITHPLIYIFGQMRRGRFLAVREIHMYACRSHWF